MATTDSPTTTSTLTTAFQYAAIAAVGYGVYYSRQRSNSSKQPPQPAKPVAEPEPRAEKRAKKQRVQQYAQDASTQKQGSSKAQPKASESPKQDAAAEEEDSDDGGLSNQELARQLASVKEGKKFTAKPTSSNKNKQKSVKQSQAQVHEPSKKNTVSPPKKNIVSPPSSTGGIDADDDQSPPQSPEVVAADGSGISDMLEAAAPKPIFF